METEEGDGKEYVSFLRKLQQEIRESDVPFIPLGEGEEADALLGRDELPELKHRSLIHLQDMNPLITVFGPKIVSGMMHPPSSHHISLGGTFSDRDLGTGQRRRNGNNSNLWRTSLCTNDLYLSSSCT